MKTETLGHLVKRYDMELLKLKKRVLDMGGLVSEQLQRIPLLIKEENEEVALAAIDSDRQINTLELKADKLIIKVIARRAPVGSDLRFIVAVSRMVADLERLGDETTRMAQSLISECRSDGICEGASAYEEVAALTQLAGQLFGKSMCAFEELDVIAAGEVAYGSAGPDGELNKRLSRLSQCAMKPGVDVAQAVNLVLALRSLEHIVGYTRGISEHVIYLVSGEDVRHQDD